MITPDFKFRQSILKMLYELKSAMGDDFNDVIDSLKESLDELPPNNFEQSCTFFTKVTQVILGELEDYFEIDYNEKETKDLHCDLFTLKLDDDTSKKLELFERYTKNNNKFTNSFLNHFDYNLWRKLRFNSFNRSLPNRYEKDNEGNLAIKKNSIKKNSTVFLPIYAASVGDSFFSTLYREVNIEKKAIREMIELYEPLTKAVEAFKVKIMEQVKENHKKFGISTFKDMLSEIILPVELLVDEELKNKCTEENRQVFIKRPEIHHLLKIGMAVHVYADSTLSDESFIAKPVPATGAPKVIKGLVYVGTGHYTGYNETSSRSQKKVCSHIINDNLFVKININDFLKELPKKLREEIIICEKILESIGFNEKNIEIISNRYYRDFIQNLQDVNVLSVNKLLTYFMDIVIMLKDTDSNEESSNQEHTDELFKDTNFSFNKDLFTNHHSLPYQYALIKDNHSGYAAMKLEEGKEPKIFLSLDINDCCRALRLNTGLYSVYSFYKREQHRSQAFLTFHKYTKEKRSE